MEKKLKKQILLLGGFGFLGTNILKIAEKNFNSDFEFIVFDKLTFHPHNIQFSNITKVYDGDFSDERLIESIFQENQIDLVIHLISTTVPALGYSARYDIETNLLPSVQLLDLLVKYNILDIIFISSGGAVYGNSEENEKHKETDNLYPLSSYGVTKLTIEKYLMQFASLYGLRPLILRLSNPYGKYHYSLKQGICNVALRTAMNKEVFKVWGDGKAIKDYIYIDDFVEILFSLYNLGVHTEVLNVGSGKLYSINQILIEIQENINDLRWEYSPSSKYDVSNFELDCSNLGKYMKDKEYVSLQEGLKETINWLHTEESK